MPKRPAVSPRTSSKFAAWLQRELIATLGVVGAVLTLLAELDRSIRMAPVVSQFLDDWRSITESVWGPLVALTGIELHPNFVAALTIAAFLVTIGIGTRISAARSAQPLPSMQLRRFWDTDYQTWPSLIALGAVCLIVLLGHTTGSEDNPRIFGSERLGGWVFALVATAGYLIGEFFGGREFHRRLVRTLLAVAVIAALNWVWLHGATST